MLIESYLRNFWWAPHRPTFMLGESHKISKMMIENKLISFVLSNFNKFLSKNFCFDHFFNILLINLIRGKSDNTISVDLCVLIYN